MPRTGTTTDDLEQLIHRALSLQWLSFLFMIGCIYSNGGRPEQMCSLTEAINQLQRLRPDVERQWCSLISHQSRLMTVRSISIYHDRTKNSNILRYAYPEKYMGWVHPRVGLG